MQPSSILITCGDPAGCGPKIITAALANFKPGKQRVILCADRPVMEAVKGYKKISSRIELIDCRTPGINKLKSGAPSALSGRASLNYLDTGLKVMDRLGIKSLVTGPVSKEAVAMSLPDFCGHTEYLAQKFRVKECVMLMVAGKMKIALLTRHVPLRDVPAMLKPQLLIKTSTIIKNGLRDVFGLSSPKIAVAAFNPHAGKDTFLDREDRRIAEAIKLCPRGVFGPFPPDTLFTTHNIAKFDCLIALYHDQGMIPFKLLGFDQGVNLTLGLPIRRTSPAHGPAYDIVRLGKEPLWRPTWEAIRLCAKEY